jgi:hypothetical protein
MKPGSLVKKGTCKSWVGADDPGTSTGAALEAFLSRLSFEGAATEAASFTLSACLPL